MRPLPSDFKEKIKELLGKEAELLIAALDTSAPVSIRVNLRKPVVEFSHDEPVKWCDSGFYLSERPEFIFDPLFHAGAYYVQEASSMIYEPLMTRIVNEFKKEYPGSKLKVLDLCAAPGGKTTAMINSLPDGSIVVANEYSSKRVGALRENLTKWGYQDISVTNRDSNFYATQGESYDVVAVDAPCSGEGMMRKDEYAREQWSPELVSRCSALQKEILRNAVKALKPGGFLIYSTCTFNRHENEENAEFISEELGLHAWDPDFPEDWGICKGIDTDLPVCRFLPHKIKGEGLFLAVFRKPGLWTPDINPLAIGNKKEIKTSNSKKDEVPGIEQILANDNNLDYIPKIDLSLQDAIAYLRRESIPSPAGVPKGLVIVTYKGLHLGPAKNIGSRMNNLYPKNWRILKR